MNEYLRQLMLQGVDPVLLARQIVQERASGGGVRRLLIDEYPTQYLPDVGRQVMADGGMPAYQDAPTQHIEDWQWRPLEDVKDQLQLTEIPSHVAAFGQFMDETANKAGTQGLSARDLIKAYTITRASIQRRARPADALRQVGLDLPTGVEGMVRPEGAFGHWLHTPMGQKYLKFAEQGQVDDEAVRSAVQIMAPFGKHEKDIPDALIWAAKNLPGQEARVSRLVAAAQQMQSAPQEWRDMATQFRGIGPSKSGFVASIMGRGDQPTLDARQVILHTGRPTSEAQPFLRRKKGSGATEAVERLADRQTAMGLDTPGGLEPYYQHLAHHAVWDKASDETTTHQDVIDAMRHAATGGRIEDEDNPILNHPVAQVMASMGASEAPEAAAQVEKQPVPYQSWADVPTINPQDLVGKKVFPIFADLTKAGSAFGGIDASKLDQPEQLYGGPGYPLLPEVQQHGLAWAVEGKGRGTSKLLKDADYVAVSAMEPYSHQSNASFSNVLMKNMGAYVRDKRLAPENLAQINDMIRAPSAQKELKGLEQFPGFEDPNVEQFLRGMTFEQRKRVAQVLSSKAAQDLGAPNIAKITRETLDPEFSGVPSRHAMFLLQIPRTKEGKIDDEEMKRLLVHLKTEGLPEHPSYQYGIKGNLVGKFHTPVAPDILFKDWFDKANAEAAAKQARGEATNVRRAFDLAMPVVTVSQEVADMLPRHPRDIQSGKAAQLALNAFNDQWDTTETPVGKGGLSPAMLSQALKDSTASSMLEQYTPKQIQDMIKAGQFTAYKLKGGEVYFGLKKGTDYAQKYGFEHPDLTPNETTLESVINNEPGARGVGGAPVVLKAIQHGATALNCFAVPSKRHPQGFLPEFYSNFGFEELGRVPFDEKSYSEQQLKDMKHEWTKAGWDESMGLPALSIMKWKGDENDRTDAVRRHLEQSSASDRPGAGSANVGSAAGLTEQGSESAFGEAQGERGIGDAGRNRGSVRDDRSARSSNGFTRTLSEIKNLSPEELAHYGLKPEDIEFARARGLSSGGEVGSDFIPHGHPDRDANFQNWFEGSAVKRRPISSRDKGPFEPLVVYHGSPKEFSRFNAVGTGVVSHTFGRYETPRHGMFFAEDPSFASSFAEANAGKGKSGAQVYPVHLSIKNPLWATSQGLDNEDVEKLAAVGVDRNWLTRYAGDPRSMWEQFDGDDGEFFTGALKVAGYDGVHMEEHDPETGEDKRVWVALHPTQVKSATGNQGTFDPSDPDITKASGGEVESDTPYHQTPEFQNWFGDSVTHNEGVPITYCHGTSKDADFPSFKVGRHGIWMTTSPAEASEYAAQNDSQNFKYEGGKYVRTNTASRVIPVHIKAENPYRGDRPDFGDAENYKKLQSDWFDTLRRQGYDSWIPDIYKGGIAVVLKDPTQIKSIYNRKFDPKNKRMDKGAGGPAIAKLRQMSDPAVNKAIRAINKSGSSPRDAVTLSKRLLGRQ